MKPSNILLDQHTRARLADFGLAREALPSGHSLVASHLSGVLPSGTQGFLDPLFVNSGRLSATSDGFALGIVMLQALTALPVVDILARCRRLLRSPSQPAVWAAPGVADVAAGWPEVTWEDPCLALGLGFGPGAGVWPWGWGLALGLVFGTGAGVWPWGWCLALSGWPWVWCARLWVLALGMVHLPLGMVHLAMGMV